MADSPPALGNMLSDLRVVAVDLHLHTVVSPCAEVEMIPPLIVQQAQRLGLRMLAVTDHHTVDNVEAVQRAAEGTGITVLPGMEVQSREEAHIVCLFETLEAARAWEQIVYEHLPQKGNRADVFGEQFVVDERGEFVRHNHRLLLASCSLSSEQIVAQVGDLGGLSVAAHVDRPSYSLLTNLGFIPPDLSLAALELSARGNPAAFLARNPGLVRWPLIISGDAHRLSEMRARTKIRVMGPSFTELMRALGKEGGREVILDS